MKRAIGLLAALALCGPLAAQDISFRGPSSSGSSTDLTAANTLGTAYGADMVTNGTFTGNATGWTLGLAGGAPDWAYATNNVTHGNGGGTATLEPSTPLTVVAGRTYLVTYTISGLTAGTVTASIGGTSATAASVNGTFVHALVAADTTNLKFTPTTTLVATIDTVSVLEGKATTVANLTAGRFTFAGTGGRLTDSAAFLADDSGGGDNVVTARKTMSGASNTSSFLSIVGTLPTTLAAVTNAMALNFTTAGSSAQQIRGMILSLLAGYTGTSSTAVLFGNGTVAGTDTWASGFTSGTGNRSFVGSMSSTTVGTNFGGVFTASGGDISVGVFGSAPSTKNSATNYGVMGISGNAGTTPCRVGGYFGFNATAPTCLESALLADNALVGAPIESLRDNGTLVDQVIDGGARWAKIGTKTLTESSATLFVRIDVPSNGRQGGIVEYCVDADDGTEFQSRCGSVSFGGANKAGAENCGVGTPADGIGTSSGTLTISFDTETAGTNQCGIRATAVSSLTQTTLRLNYTVREFGNAATAVTAQ